jgi:hypothetical protein
MVMIIPVEVCFRENGFVRFVKVKVWDRVVIVDGRLMDSFRGMLIWGCMIVWWRCYRMQPVW